MPLVTIKIDNKDFEIECGDGEEELLRKAEQKLNLKINNHKELITLPESKRYLMIALIIIGENIDNDLKNKKIEQIFIEINKELTKLENKLELNNVRNF